MNTFNSLGSNYSLSFVLESFKKPKRNSTEKLKNFLEKKYEGKVVLTYKGREALVLALKSLRLKKNSKIGVTGFTCIAVIDSIERSGNLPLYLDINPLTLNFTNEELENKIKKENISAVIIQNTLGYPCDIDRIAQVCKKYKLALVEDLAHSIGTVYSNGKETGTVGDMVCLSFSQDKVIDSVSGGALILKNSEFRVENFERKKEKVNYQDVIYPLLTWVIRKTYPIGVGKILHFTFQTLQLLSNPMKNSESRKMSNWHAGLALYEFKKLKKTLEHKRKIAKIYADNLPDGIVSGNILKFIKNGTNLRFPIFVDNREKLVKFLKSKGIYVSDIWYDSPVAPIKYLGLAKYPKHSCPKAEKVSREILNLPTHINITEKNALKISEYIRNYFNL